MRSRNRFTSRSLGILLFLSPLFLLPSTATALDFYVDAGAAGLPAVQAMAVEQFGPTVVSRGQAKCRHRADKREILPDPKFGNVVVTKFMNSVMHAGKKSVAENIVYGALDMIEGKTRQSPVAVFQQALDNVMPSIEVRSRRVGGATYQVPVEVRTSRRQALGIRWINSAARERNEKTMTERLSGELLDASNNRGNAVKKRDDTHRMAQANRAFLHYRW